MSLKNVDLNLFVIFDAIYTERNLTRAAEVLCITQPAVSNALKRLRVALNDQLFVRTPQAMTPTPVADNIIGQVREALKLLTTSVQEGDVFSPTNTNRSFNFSMNDMAESLIMPQLLEQFQKDAVSVNLTSYPNDRNSTGMLLASGALDLAIDIPVIKDENLCHRQLSSTQYACVVAHNHPINSNTKLTMEQYLGLQHLLVSSRPKGLGHVDMILNTLGYSRNIQLRISHYLVALEVAKRSQLALTLPRSMAEYSDLKILELPFKSDALEWHLYWHKSADKDQGNIWLREMTLALFDQD